MKIEKSITMNKYILSIFNDGKKQIMLRENCFTYIYLASKFNCIKLAVWKINENKIKNVT